MAGQHAHPHRAFRFINPEPFPRKVDRFSQRFVILLLSKRQQRTATSVPKPASMTEPLPPIVTLKHLAEWAGYNHGVAKKQAIEVFTGFVADIGRVLKKGSKIRIPNLGVLQVRIRPARPARKGRNPATGGDPDQSR